MPVLVDIRDAGRASFNTGHVDVLFSKLTRSVSQIQLRRPVERRVFPSDEEVQVPVFVDVINTSRAVPDPSETRPRFGKPPFSVA